MSVAITPEAATRLAGHFRRLDRPGARVRIFIDHRCHCGKSHFTMALDDQVSSDDRTFEVQGVPFVVDPGTAEELPLAEIDFVKTAWQEGFTIRNREHNCGMHM